MSASIVAMALAMIFHAAKVGDTVLNGLEVIRVTTEKRLYSQNPAAVAQENCGQTINAETCIAEIERSLSAPLPVVVLAYATFRRNMPWIAGPDIIDDPVLVSVRRSLRNCEIRLAYDSLLSTRVHGIMGFTNLFLTLIVGWSTIALAIRKLFKDKKQKASTFFLVISAAGPLSWYTLAKCLSYGHMHINFVLWASFFAFVFAYLTTSTVAKRNDLGKEGASG